MFSKRKVKWLYSYKMSRSQCGDNTSLPNNCGEFYSIRTDEVAQFAKTRHDVFSKRSVNLLCSYKMSRLQCGDNTSLPCNRGEFYSIRTDMAAQLHYIVDITNKCFDVLKLGTQLYCQIY